MEIYKTQHFCIKASVSICMYIFLLQFQFKAILYIEIFEFVTETLLLLFGIVIGFENVNMWPIFT